MYYSDTTSGPLHHVEDFLSALRIFVTPSGNISCVLNPVHQRDTDQINCQINSFAWANPHPGTDYCHFTTFKPGFMTVTPGRPPFMGGCYGGEPWPTRGNVLPYGATVTQGDFACRSDLNFVACAYLPAGSGFVVNRSRYTLINGPTDRASALPFLGRWSSHGGDLSITPPDTLTERFVVGGDMTVTMALTNPRLVAGIPNISARVTSVSGNANGGAPPPHVGATGVILEDNGVLRSPLLAAQFCDDVERGQGTCGA